MRLINDHLSVFECLPWRKVFMRYSALQHFDRMNSLKGLENT
jgi:hypothetical protein